MKIWKWRTDGTKILGMLSMIKDILVGLVAIEGFFPPGWLKYIAAFGVVVGVLTIKRGYTNSVNSGVK